MKPSDTILPDDVINYVVHGEEKLSKYKTWQGGALIKEGGSWLVRFRELRIQEDGTTKSVPGKRIRLGRSSGPGRISKSLARELQRAEAEAFNDKPTARSLMTVRQFVGGMKDDVTGKPWGQFVPEWVLMRDLSANARKDYLHMLSKHILPALGEVSISDVTSDQVQRLITIKSKQYSGATVSGIRKVLRLVINHAKRRNLYTGDNPAGKDAIVMPRVKSEPVKGYTWDEVRLILDRLPEPIWTMVVQSIATSVNAAELLGIRAGRVNYGDQPKITGADVIPPRSIGIRENFSNGRYGDVKTGNRRRNVPIPEILLEKIAALCEGKSDEQALFANRKGTGPIDAHNVTNRLFRRLGDELGLKVNWHRFRHSNATLTDFLGMDPDDRRKMMGHGSLSMTSHYTDPFERQRLGANAVMEKLFRVKDGSVVQ